jgi:hypothetical protein
VPRAEPPDDDQEDRAERGDRSTRAALLHLGCTKHESIWHSSRVPVKPAPTCTTDA